MKCCGNGLRYQKNTKPKTPTSNPKTPTSNTKSIFRESK